MGVTVASVRIAKQIENESQLENLNDQSMEKGDSFLYLHLCPERIILDFQRGIGGG